MSGSESDEHEEQWLLNLHEFIEALQPQLKELEALTQVEEFVANLESTDSSFHRYNFVAQIKDRLDTELTPMIDDLLVRKKNEQDILTPDISEDLFDLQEFQNTSSSIITAIQSASENVTSHLNSNTFDFSGPLQKYDRPSNYFNASSSVCSTTDGMEFMFMPPDRYKSLAKDIDPLKSNEQRLKALTILQQVPQTDLVASDAWELTRYGLHKALNDENEEINTRALKFISRLFVSGSSHVIKEYFLLIIENLTEYFLDSTSHMISLDSGLDLGDRRNILLLKKFRLLNDIQKQLPATWLRYSEKYVEEMIEAFVKLLGVSTPKIASTRDATIMNPLHLLALVDPHAIWFKKWMHGYYSRLHLIASISNHTSFLKRPIKSCIEACKRLHNFKIDSLALDKNAKADIAFENSDILYLHFLHSTNFLSRLMLYRDGRDVLHFELNNGKILDIDMLIVALFDIMKFYPFPVSKSLYHGGNLAAECFKMLSNGDIETVHACLCFESLYKSVIQAFQQKGTSLPLVIDMLAEIAISSVGCDQLMLKRDLAGYDECVSVLDVLADLLITTEYLEDDINRTNTISPLMTLFQRIFKNFNVLILLSKYKIEQFLTNLLKKQKSESDVLFEKLKNSISQNAPQSPHSAPPGSGSGSARRSAENTAYKKSLLLEKQIMESIMCLTLTPNGVEIVLQCDVFEECVAYFHERILEKGRTASNGYGTIMSQVCSTSEGTVALLKCEYVVYLLNEIWFYLEGFTNDYTVTALHDIPQDFADILSQKLFASLNELVPNIHSVRALFRSSFHQDSSPSSSSSSPAELQCFEDFFCKLVLLKVPPSVQLFHTEQTHYFALNVLSYLVTSLDVMLFLQAKYNMQQALLDLQQESFHSDRDCFVLDQNSVKRNQILVQTYLIGGANERKIPPHTLSEDNSYQWPLFSSYPVPAVYSFKGHASAFSPDSNLTKLKELLREERDFTTITLQDANKLKQDLKELFLMAIKNRLLKDEEETYMLLFEMHTKLLSVVMETATTTSGHRDNNGGMESPGKKERDEKFSNKKKMLSDEDELAVQTLVCYGVTLRLLDSQNDHVEILRRLLSSLKNYFQSDQSQLIGFDWFLGLMFLIFKGDEQRTFQFVTKFATFPEAVSVWPYLGVRKNGPISLLRFSSTCHWLECIINNELPQVYAAFQISGVSPSQICQLWLQQCFLNYLDWPDIVTYVTCCIVMGADYRVYFIVSLLKHLKEDILREAQNNNLLIYLRTNPIQGFRLNQYFEYWQQLEEKYRHKIEVDCQNENSEER